MHDYKRSGFATQATKSEGKSQLAEWLKDRGLDAEWSRNLELQENGSFVAKGLSRELNSVETVVSKRNEKVLATLLKAIEAFNKL